MTQTRDNQPENRIFPKPHKVVESEDPVGVAPGESIPLPPPAEKTSGAFPKGGRAEGSFGELPTDPARTPKVA